MGGNPWVLLVEDDMTLAPLMERLFAEAGLKTVLFSGPGAVRKGLTQGGFESLGIPSLIMTEVEFIEEPALAPISWLSELRRVEHWSRIPILVFSRSLAVSDHSLQKLMPISQAVKGQADPKSLLRLVQNHLINPS